MALGARLEFVHWLEHRFGDGLASCDPPREHPSDGRPTVIGAKPLCDPGCFPIHLRQLRPGEALARIRPVWGAFLPLALPPFGDDFAGPLRPPVSGAQLRLGADVLQFGLPGANLLLLLGGGAGARSPGRSRLDGWNPPSPVFPAGPSPGTPAGRRHPS
jgi:hypothetical protein